MNKACYNFQILNKEMNRHKKQKIKIWCREHQKEGFNWKELLHLAGEKYGHVRVHYNQKQNVNQVIFEDYKPTSSLKEQIGKMQNDRKPKGSSEPKISFRSKSDHVWKMYQELKKILMSQGQLGPELEKILPDPNQVKIQKTIFQEMVKNLPPDNAMRRYVETCLSI